MHSPLIQGKCNIEHYVNVYFKVHFTPGLGQQSSKHLSLQRGLWSRTLSTHRSPLLPPVSNCAQEQIPLFHCRRSWKQLTHGRWVQYFYYPFTTFHTLGLSYCTMLSYPIILLSPIVQENIL